MPAPRYTATNANGHRRRELVKRVLKEEHLCALCQTPVDKTLSRIPGAHTPNCSQTDCQGCKWHPLSPVVDEDIPRARGGSPTSRDNCHLMHRKCNQAKGTMTLEEARRKAGTDKPNITTPATLTHGW